MHLISYSKVCFIYHYYLLSTFYIVKFPYALGNIFHWTESIFGTAYDDAKNPYWGINIDFDTAS